MQRPPFPFRNFGSRLDQFVERAKRTARHHDVLVEMTHQIVDDVHSVILEQLGSCPPECWTPLTQALDAASIGSVPRVVNRIEEALLHAERLWGKRRNIADPFAP